MPENASAGSAFRLPRPRPRPPPRPPDPAAAAPLPEAAAPSPLPPRPPPAAPAPPRPPLPPRPRPRPRAFNSAMVWAGPMAAKRISRGMPAAPAQYQCVRCWVSKKMSTQHKRPGPSPSPSPEVRVRYPSPCQNPSPRLDATSSTPPAASSRVSFQLVRASSTTSTRRQQLATPQQKFVSTSLFVARCSAPLPLRARWWETPPTPLTPGAMA